MTSFDDDGGGGRFMQSAEVEDLQLRSSQKVQCLWVETQEQDG